MGNSWPGRRVLVTGAGGFIASHLVERLVGEGARVRAFVRYNSRGDPGLLRLVPAETLAEVEILAGDLRDLPSVEEAMQNITTVFHLGALIAIPYSYAHPAEVVETNVIGTLNVLLAGRGSGVTRIVHTSTSEVYGSALQVPIDENHPLQGQSPYSASKIGADKLAESFYRSFDLPVVTVRPFNTYGPRQSARAVVPAIITQALTQSKIRLGNLEARRDLTFISDTVDGFIKVAEAPDVEGEVFNLGYGSEVQIGELAEQIIRLVRRPADQEGPADQKTRILVDPVRLRPEKSEVERLLADNRLAREKLGWRPEVALEEGLARTIEWIQTHLDYYSLGEYQI